MTATAPDGYRLLDVDEAEERFRLSADVESRFPYREFSDEQEFRLYEGGLHVTGDFSAETDGDWVMYNVIVDGDLTVDGDLSWWDDHMGNFVLVTGNVRARNVLLRGNPSVVVRGDLLVDNGVFGCHGADGGFLDVGGVTRAKTIVNIRYFKMTFAGGRPDATLIADPNFTSCPVDFADDELSAVLLPAMVDPDGYVDEGQIEWAFMEGRPILRDGAVPSHLAALTELDALLASPEEVIELDLADRHLREFPEQLFAFPNLRKLSLAGNDQIDQIPERIAELTTLEELDLSGLAVDRLPAAIGRLDNLRVLDVSGNPLPDNLFSMTKLEELRLAGVQQLPADAFAAMPELRRLDLSGGALTELPEPFYRLRHLQAVDLHATKLDRPTLDRLAETFPKVQIDLRRVPARRDVDDPNSRAVHDLVVDGQAKLFRDHAAAVPLFEEALERCGTGASFSDHDQLYAYYGLVYALSRLVGSDEGLTDKLIGYAERALALAPEPREIWHFTDEGQFHEEVTRTAGNTLAWHLMKRGELDRALSIVDRALTFGADPTYDYLRDTKVRILLAMGRTAEAYLIVDHVLTRRPDFGDFADFVSAPEFLHWRETTR
ncbi:hypothetical protein ACIA8G_04955 [Lentzea sp. NPDC051213]|uniref:leucine-rich repeat domain-containing protein n=1 Tax=Lentzea sp. NPDC051213 TaxID=3364126 RepID=UPI00379F80DC